MAVTHRGKERILPLLILLKAFANLCVCGRSISSIHYSFVSRARWPRSVLTVIKFIRKLTSSVPEHDRKRSSRVNEGLYLLNSQGSGEVLMIERF